MNEITNKNIETYLKNNRFVRFDEIDKIMRVVDGLTEWKNEQGQPTRQEEPPLRAFFRAQISVPVWTFALAFGIGFFIGYSL